MSSNLAHEVPEGKYNKWCERRPLVCADETKLSNTDKYVERSDLTLSEKSAFYTHELVGCEGLEFVVFSNARLDTPMILPGHITIVPCFLPEDKQGLDNNLAMLTKQMAQRSQFIYDGWLPILDWKEEVVHKAIRNVEAALSVFTLRAPVWFSWEPKYSPIARGESYYNFGHRIVSQANDLSKFIDQLSEADSRAILSSIAWLSQSLRLTEPAAKFLFSILAIESLGIYIEEEADGASIFSKLCSVNLTKTERREQRKDCIIETIKQFYKTDPEVAIKTAYFDCVVGIKQRLKKHLEVVFVDNMEVVNLLFGTEVEGKTLYDLRNDIAHGRFDALSEAQREKIYTRAWDIESTARKYILKVLRYISGKSIYLEQIPAVYSFDLKDGIVSNQSMYRGPIHMAELYSSSDSSVHIVGSE